MNYAYNPTYSQLHCSQTDHGPRLTVSVQYLGNLPRRLHVKFDNIAGERSEAKSHKGQPPVWFYTRDRSKTDNTRDTCRASQSDGIPRATSRATGKCGLERANPCFPGLSTMTEIMLLRVPVLCGGSATALNILDAMWQIGT